MVSVGRHVLGGPPPLRLVEPCLHLGTYSGQSRDSNAAGSLVDVSREYGDNHGVVLRLDGQTVEAPSEGRDLNIPRGPLVVVRLLPVADGEPQYSVRSEDEGHEWVVLERQIRPWGRRGQNLCLPKI